MRNELIGAIIFQICFALTWGLIQYGFNYKALIHTAIAAPIGSLMMGAIILLRRRNDT